MENAGRTLEVGAGQIGEEAVECRRHDHCLETDGVRRQARHVEIALVQILFGAPPGHEQPPRKVRSLHSRRRIDENLLYPWQRRQRVGAAFPGTDRNRSKTGDRQTLRLQKGAQAFTLRVGYFLTAVKKQHSGGKTPGQLEPGFLGHGAQVFFRAPDQQAAAIAGLAVRCYGAAVGQTLECVQRSLHEVVAGLIAQLGDQPESAAVPLVGRVVQQTAGGCRLA